MGILSQERTRLRRKYLRKVRHREFNYHAYDRWLDWEFAKTAIPLAPAAIIGFADGATTTGLVLFWIGAALSIIWFGFVLWVWVSVATRLNDKEYQLVTRKFLSKEYRS